MSFFVQSTKLKNITGNKNHKSYLNPINSHFNQWKLSKVIIKLKSKIIQNKIFSDLCANRFFFKIFFLIVYQIIKI